MIARDQEHRSPYLRVELRLISLRWKRLFHRALLFAGATLCYAAEPRSGVAAEPLDRIFVGVPNQLTLPPGFPNVLATLNPTGSPSDKPVDTAQPKNARARGLEPVGDTLSPNELATRPAPCGPVRTSKAAGQRGTREVGVTSTRVECWRVSP